MRFLFFAPRYHTNQHPLVKALLAHGHEVRFHVLNIGPTENHELLSPMLVKTTALSDLLQSRSNRSHDQMHRARYAFMSLSYYLGQLREWRPDVMVVRDPNTRASAVALLAGRLLGIRPLLYTQGPVYARTSKTVSVMRSLGARLTSGEWISPVRGDSTSEPRAHPRFHYVPFAVDPDLPVKKWESTGERIRLLDIGKFFPRKNHLLMIDAFAELVPDYDIELTILGECSTTEHERLLEEVTGRIEGLGLTDRITVRTNLPHNRVSDEYLRHDLFVLPSRAESASVSVIEAMAHGLPVVCSTTNGTKHAIKVGVNGDIFDSDDRNSLVAVLRRLLSDPERLREMGRASRALAMAEHHPNVVVERLEELAK